MNQATTIATATLPGVPTGTWVVDSAHSVLGFSVRHLMSKVRGTFTEFSGAITVADNPLDSSVTAEIAMASVSTGTQMRDNHLRSADFFDVARFPKMIFTSAGVYPAAGSWVVDGQLSIKDTTRAVRVTLDFLGFDPNGTQGEPRIGFEGRTSIRRSDFGVSFGLAEGGKLVIGDQVDILLDIEAVHTGP